MNHLKFVRILKTTEVPGFDKLVLIIPWIVVQELDRMKAGKLLKYAQHKAVPAVRFINDSLKSQDRNLWGQSIQLASQKLCKYCSLRYFLIKIFWVLTHYWREMVVKL
uniref:SWT1 RNA endoribonuclease-like protein n=1 Tax=Molossus molossus TaxID=27622 RepID=A0A7J8CUR9_MOLMO|nr:SWT1 RNA endoribonuclease-like protein [Molossus molossus]